jgi:putative glutamine amidotransferase
MATLAPRIVITVTAPPPGAPPPQPPRHQLYLDALRRHGAMPIAISAATPEEDVEAALASMAGLLLSGGVDIDPARYGRANEGSREIQRDRVELEAGAWAAAAARSLPVLGICRGLQALHVFAGGTLLQHVDGHESADPAAPQTHPIDVVDGTRLASVLDVGDDDGPVVVNAFHHQGILASDLAAGLIASAWADSPAGALVEGLEAPGERFVVGVQCHPERTASTPAAFERLFEAFVAAARSERVAPG